MFFFFQIGAHCYYLNESPPSESLDGLIEFFVKGLDCLVQQKSKVTEENAKKGFENILYVREFLNSFYLEVKFDVFRLLEN
jgi:hypothetical protein